jgi:hypothetical protein
MSAPLAFYGQNPLWRALFIGLLATGLLAVQIPRLAHLSRHFTRLRHALRFERAPLAALPLPATPGGWIRVRGQVLDGPTFDSATGQPCVLASYVGGRTALIFTQAHRQQGEVHATSFRVVLPSREVVRVLVEHARFLSRPVVVNAAFLQADPLAVLPLTTRTGARAWTRILHQELIAPGDHIELLGCFHRTLDRAGSAGSRTPAVETIVTGDARRPLLLRTADPESLR